MHVSPRILVVVLLPALAALALGVPLLWTNLTRVAERGAADHLEATLSLVTPLVLERLDEPQPELQRWVRTTMAHPALRLTIIRPDGTVVADSSRSWEQMLAMDDHSTRPEVVQARETGLGTAVRRSSTLAAEFVYVAQLAPPGDASAVTIRLGQPLAALAGVRSRLAGLTWAVLLVGLATLAVATIWLNAHLFRPLSHLAAGADRMAKGDFGHRVEIDADQALDRVGSSLNRLASRVQEQMQAVEKERSHLEVVGASMSEGILVTDGEGRALLVNPSFRRLFRVKGDVEGRTAMELTMRPEVEDMIRATLESGETRSGELELRAPRRRLVAVTSSLLQDASGVVVAARDISDLIELAEIRRDLVANVSHELKTPLAAIRGYAETLGSGALREEAGPRFVERILQQCQRLQALLDDLLTLSRLESVDGSAEFESIDLADALRETIEVLGRVAAEKGVAVTVSVEEPLRIEANRVAIDELCLNLVDNAIKYNRRDGSVDVAGRLEEDRLILTVADTGRGIPQEALPRLFERFYRVDRGRAREEGGTGLGLAIVKHAVKLHGGEIDVESELGRGSTFRVELPARQDDRSGVQLEMSPE